jgi:hypothetical protein
MLTLTAWVAVQTPTSLGHSLDVDAGDHEAQGNP